MGAIESVQRSMRRAATSELTQLESFVSFLGLTESSARTIHWPLGNSHWHHVRISEDWPRQRCGLKTVAPGIGGTLVATAFGLFAAIPAVIAYNYLLSRIRVLDSEMENFAADFSKYHQATFLLGEPSDGI